MNKIRLDKALLKTISSRAKAQDMIKEGKISVNGKVITKASYLVSDEDDIVVTHTQDEFVSRGAFKLRVVLTNTMSIFQIKLYWILEQVPVVLQMFVFVMALKKYMRLMLVIYNSQKN